ncbi:MAG: PilZ domain-containing protein [Spirochaetaceae bacterium]|jgi:hypothetical protein|nr:PilZ domain-containing protein [Spirochaetaceae bacterium]
MKLLLILGSDETYNVVSRYVKPLGFDLIRYQQVIKAMDNIDEVDPAGIVLSANDFPRHWKPLVHFVRTTRAKDQCPVVLLVGENFSLEEAGKAFYIGVSGIVPEFLDEPLQAAKLQNVLGRYIPLEEKRRSPRFLIEPWMRCALVLAHPVNKAIVIGKIKTLSRHGIFFSPDHPSLVENLYPETALNECSFRLDDAILSPKCRLVRSGRLISLEFVSFSPGEQRILDTYLKNLPARELQYRRQALRPTS